MELWAKHSKICIASEPNDMHEGLFGQVILYVLEILPYLHTRGIFPDWKIRAAHYGAAPDGLVIPGVLDLAYQVEPGSRKELKLVQLRAHRRYALGNDWRRLSEIWKAYFRIPHRIAESAESLGSLSDAIGVHYRGNDKATASWDTNPVSHDDYLLIIRQFVKERPQFKRIFLATDDFSFFHYLKSNISMEIINLGVVGFHKAEISREAADAKTDRAMLDCVALSRCGVVLQTSSALSSFTKILNPDLEVYRVAASKLFHSAPYFPVAYIPIYKPSSPEVSSLIERLTIGDWMKAADAELYSKPFAFREHWPPMIRFLYSYVRKVEQLPGFGWVRLVPKWASAYNRRRQNA